MVECECSVTEHNPHICESSDFPKSENILNSKAIVNIISWFNYFKCGVKTLNTEYKGTKIWMVECFGYLNSEQFVFASLKPNSIFNIQPTFHKNTQHSFTCVYVQHRWNSLTSGVQVGGDCCRPGLGHWRQQSSTSLIPTNSQPKAGTDVERDTCNGQALLSGSYICPLKPLAAVPQKAFHQQF